MVSSLESKPLKSKLDDLRNKYQPTFELDIMEEGGGEVPNQQVMFGGSGGHSISSAKIKVVQNRILQP